MKFSLAPLIAFTFVALDLATATQFEAYFQRSLICAAGVFLLAWQNGWRWKELGFRWDPRQGIRYWVKASLVLGAVVLLVTALGHGLMVYLNGDSSHLTWKFRSSEEFLRWIGIFGIWIPMHEELIYRVVLCAGLQAIVKSKTWVIALAGIVFGYLHFVYGVAAPENLIGGFVMTWAFVESGCLWISYLLHFVGNTLAGLSHFF